MCGELGAWSDYCLKTIAVADFSIGGRDLPYRICETISREEKEKCYLQLSGMISMYAGDQEEFESLCAPIADETYRAQCLRIKQF